jgi:hypothetical protein
MQEAREGKERCGDGGRGGDSVPTSSEPILMLPGSTGKGQGVKLRVVEVAPPIPVWLYALSGG